MSEFENSKEISSELQVEKIKEKMKLFHDLYDTLIDAGVEKETCLAIGKMNLKDALVFTYNK